MVENQCLEKMLADGPANICDITRIVVEVAAATGGSIGPAKREHSDEVKQLFEDRRSELDPVARKRLSTQLWRALRKQRRQRQDREIQQLAEHGQGMKSLQRLMSKHAGVQRIALVKNAIGAAVTGTAGIAEVFAQFYEDLYKTDVGERTFEEDDLSETVIPFTPAEVTAALKLVKDKRTGAEDGLVAEMLKTQCSALVEAIAKYFSEILAGSMDPPEEWKTVRLSVIPGLLGLALLENYR